MISSTTILASAGSFAAISLTAVISAHGTFIPQSALWGRNICCGPTPSNQVALTFDDGPWPDWTDRILDILQEHGVPAAFFVIGRNAADHPELLKRIDAAGHVIGNHTFDHDHLSVFRGPWYWMEQLKRTDGVIEQITGKRPALFRPPMGIKFCFTARAVRRCGHAMVTWTRSGKDGVHTSQERILRRLVPTVRGGDILTLHDGKDPHGPRTGEATIAALPRLIGELREKGLEFVRLDRLIGIDAYA